MPERSTPPTDLSRPVATSPDQYVLSIEEAQQRYEHAGYPRTSRSIQRYCKLGDLDCLRQETPFGVQYKITPESVARHIAQIAELATTTRRDEPRQDATGRDLSRQDATTDDMSGHVAPSKDGDNLPEPPIKQSSDEPRQVPTGRDVSHTQKDEEDRYVEQLEKRLQEKDAVIDLLNAQLVTKDTQIGEQNERARETNVLIKGLQNLVLQLQPGRPGPSTGETPTGQHREN